MEPVVVKIKAGEEYQRLLGGSGDTSGMRSGCVELRPGDSVGRHSTGSKEEAIIIFQGKGEISCGEGALLAAEKDTLVYIPPNTEHDVKNTGEDILRYVYVVTPVI